MGRPIPIRWFLLSTWTLAHRKSINTLLEKAPRSTPSLDRLIRGSIAELWPRTRISPFNPRLPAWRVFIFGVPGRIGVPRALLRMLVVWPIKTGLQEYGFFALRFLPHDMTQKSEIRDGMQIDWDVPIEMDDGIVLRADAYRPMGGGQASGDPQLRALCQRTVVSTRIQR